MTNSLSFKTLSGSDAALFAGKRVLLRLDLNVPIKDGAVADGFRIKQSLKTVDFLRKAGAKVIIIAHLENKEFPSLEVVCKYAQQFFPAVFVKDPWGADVATLQNLKDGDVAIVENIRNWEGEKKNDPEFAQKLAALADVYVNEAFSVSHREHASIVGVPKLLPSYAGFNFEQEVAHLSRAFNAPHPYLFILGGAKYETKAPLIQKFLGLADKVFVGGAIAGEMLKAKINVAGIITPTDVVVPTATDKKVVKKIGDVAAEENMLDSGPETLAQLTTLVNQAKFILWNGPLGRFEDGYTEGTYTLAKAVALACEKKGAEAIVGGGDTLASIEELNLVDKFTFVSTAGGAMLDFLANETLPGIEALKNSK